MTFGVRWGIPKNSILRRGTLLIGVPRKKTQAPMPSSSPLPKDSENNDPMVAAMNSLEDELQKQIAERNGQSPQSESTTRGDSETT